MRGGAVDRQLLPDPAETRRYAMTVSLHPPNPVAVRVRLRHDRVE